MALNGGTLRDISKTAKKTTGLVYLAKLIILPLPGTGGYQSGARQAHSTQCKGSMRGGVS